MTRGRKPGNPKVQDLAAGKLRVIDGGGQDESYVEPEYDQPPDWMTNAHAIAEWHRLLPDLLARKQYLRLFQTELARYCVSFGQYVDAIRAMDEDGGPVAKAKNGTPMLSQQWVIANRAHEAMVKLAADLGFNPVAQIRLSGVQFDLFNQPKPKDTVGSEPANPFGRFRRN